MAHWSAQTWYKGSQKVKEEREKDSGPGRRERKAQRRPNWLKRRKQGKEQS